MNLKLLLLFLFKFINCIENSVQSNEAQKLFNLNNYHVKINYRYENNTIYLEEYSYKFHNKLIVESADKNYELIYNNQTNSYFRLLGGSNRCEEFLLKEEKSYLDDLNLAPIGFIYKTSEVTKIGPSALLLVFKDQEMDWTNRAETERGINVTVFSNQNKFNYFGLKNLKFDLTFRTSDEKLIPIKVKISGQNNQKQKIRIIFNYFDYNAIEETGNQFIAPSRGCTELKDFFKDEKPNFAIEDKMRIEFQDVSSIDSIERRNFHIDKTEMIARLETDNEIQILDIKNKVLFIKDNENNCEIELFSSEEKFDELKFNFFKDVQLILDIKIEDFTFISTELRNGYLMRKFQTISNDADKGYQKCTIFFKNEVMDMLINEEFTNDNKLIRRTILDVIDIKVINYDETYRQLFTTPDCRSKNEYQNIHLYSIPFDQDLNLDEKLTLIKNNPDFVLSKLIETLKNDTFLNLNAFSTSSLEQSSDGFVVNSMVINVENYLIEFDEIENLALEQQALELNVRECSWKALDDKKYYGFKHCTKDSKENSLPGQQQCYLIDKVSDYNKPEFNSTNSVKLTDDNCQSYVKKENAKSNYAFHHLNKKLTDLVNQKIKYSIMIENNIKFVFNKIRFSSVFALIQNEQTFSQFKIHSKIREPILIIDNQTRLISPNDCYNQCIKQNCNSFSFCRSTDGFKMKCLLSDLILIKNDDQHLTINELKTNSNDDQLIEDRNCATYKMNYLQHFKSNGDSMMATSDSIKTNRVDSADECANSCYELNRIEKTKCGKLEVCYDEMKSDKKQFQCNLKPFANDNEIQLKNDGCEYFKINSLVDYHQTDLNENGYLTVHSIVDTIDNCAKDCSTLGDSCKEFNFCWQNFLEDSSSNLENEDGLCLWRKTKQLNPIFNASKQALNCITMIKNEHIIAFEHETAFSNNFSNKIYRFKYIKERNADELTDEVVELFIFIFVCLGILLGCIGFVYFKNSISPAYSAERGSYFPTRIVLQAINRSNKRKEDQCNELTNNSSDQLNDTNSSDQNSKNSNQTGNEAGNSRKNNYGSIREMKKLENVEYDDVLL